jgi:hypothetical protein
MLPTANNIHLPNMTAVPGGTTMDESYMAIACWEFIELTAMSVIYNLCMNLTNHLMGKCNLFRKLFL